MFHSWNVNKETAKNVKKRNLLTKCNHTFLVVDRVSLKLIIAVVLKKFDRFIQTFMFLRYAFSSELSLKKSKTINNKCRNKTLKPFYFINCYT